MNLEILYLVETAVAVEARIPWGHSEREECGALEHYSDIIQLDGLKYVFIDTLKDEVFLFPLVSFCDVT